MHTVTLSKVFQVYGGMAVRRRTDQVGDADVVVGVSVLVVVVVVAAVVGVGVRVVVLAVVFRVVDTAA